MASSRKTGTNESISTYGNGTRDYSTLTTWEADTDINLVTAMTSKVLECYDDSVSFDDYIDVGDAISNASYFRIIRPASGQGHDGTPSNGITFASTTDAPVFRSRQAEGYVQFQDLIGKLNINSASNWNVFHFASNQGACIGCIAFDSANAGAGQANGYLIYGDGVGQSIAINCIAHNCGPWGFVIYPSSYGVYNCTATANDEGFRQAGTGTSIAKNCCAVDNTTNFSGTWSQTTCYSGTVTTIFANYAGDDFHLNSGTHEAVLGAGTDLSADATYPFNDDIDGETRYQEWDIGADDLARIYTLTAIPHATFSFYGTVRLSSGRILGLKAGSADCYYSDDDGDSWTYLSTLQTISAHDPTDMFLTSAGTVLVGESGYIFRSTNNGANWSIAHTMLWGGLIGAPTGQNKIWNFTEDDFGNIWGTRYPQVSPDFVENTPSEILISSDDGVTWSTAYGGTHLCDRFDESGSAPTLNNHDPDVGDISSWSGDASGMVVGDGTGYLTKSASGSGYAINSTSTLTTPNANNQGMKIKGKTGGSTSIDRFGVILRATDSSNLYYAAISGDGYIKIYKRVSGSDIQLGSSYSIPDFSASTYYTLFFVVNGTTLEAWWGNPNYSISLRVSTTDSTYSSGSTGLMMQNTNASVAAVAGGPYPTILYNHFHGCGHNTHNGFTYFCIEHYNGSGVGSGMLRHNGSVFTKIISGYQFTVVVSRDVDDKIYLGADTSEDSKIYYIDDDGSTMEDSQTKVLLKDFGAKGYFQDMTMLADGNLIISSYSNSPSGDYAAIFCTSSPSDWSVFEERQIKRGLSPQQGFSFQTKGDLSKYVLVRCGVGSDSYRVTSPNWTDFVLTGSRIANASRVWQAAEDAAVTEWDVANDFIVAAMVEGIETGNIQLLWRKDGGAWNTLSGSGELTWSATTDLVNGNAVASGEKGCTPISGSSWVDGVEREGANGLSTTLASGEYTEHHWAIDINGATPGATYEFSLYDVTGQWPIGTCLASVTIRSVSAPVFMLQHDHFEGGVIH